MMKKDIRVIWIIFYTLIIPAFLLALGTDVMADADSLNSGNKSGRIYRHSNQTVLSDKGEERVWVGSSLEVDLPADAGGEATAPEDTDKQFTIRTADMFLQFEKIGKISFGQGETASQVISQIDLSGTDFSGYYGMDNQSSGIFFYDSEATAISNPTFSQLSDTTEAKSRKDRLRYDTPSFNGFSASFSRLSDQDREIKTGEAAYDAALSYSGGNGDLAMAAAVAYSAHPADTQDGKDRLVKGSASLAFSGFSIQLRSIQSRYVVRVHRVEMLVVCQ